MKKTIFKDKYPVWSFEVKKSETDKSSVDEIVEYFIDKINIHPISTYIATFNHYEHTKSLKDGKINPDIKDVKNVVFCFGKEIPNTKVTAVRPRSIAVCELEDSFAIEFIEAPSEKLNGVMQEWTTALAK
jgi:hypothetical protein